jgi:hypothetical protein
MSFISPKDTHASRPAIRFRLLAYLHLKARTDSAFNRAPATSRGEGTLPRPRPGQLGRCNQEVSKMKHVLGILAAAFLFCSSAAGASDGFGNVRCGADVPKALVGQTMSDERVVAIEARHKDLGLKDLGGSEISDRLFLASWQICGDEYALLEEKNVVRDALKVPPHSKDSPEFIGSCRSNGKELPDTIIAVLRDEKGAENLAATAAWKIDRKGNKFAALATEGLRCPRDGVITSDGGL